MKDCSQELVGNNKVEQFKGLHLIQIEQDLSRDEAVQSKLEHSPLTQQLRNKNDSMLFMKEVIHEEMLKGFRSVYADEGQDAAAYEDYMMAKNKRSAKTFLTD